MNIVFNGFLRGLEMFGESFFDDLKQTGHPLGFDYPPMGRLFERLKRSGVHLAISLSLLVIPAGICFGLFWHPFWICQENNLLVMLVANSNNLFGVCLI